jgi:hypothetical protein
MRKTLLAFVAMLAALALAPSASAVKFGEPDTNNQYPWVGLMVAVDDDGEPLWRCTGSLLSADLFLTAGHCVGDPQAAPGDRPAKVYLWFTTGAEIITTDPQYAINLAYQATLSDAAAEAFNVCLGDPTKTDAAGHPLLPVLGYPCGGYDAWGLPQSYSLWTGSLTIPQTYDVGVVHHLVWTSHLPIQGHPFTQPTTYGTLADVGTLDALAASPGKGNIQFTVVGYGLQSVKPVESALKQRLVGTVSFVNMQSALSCQTANFTNPNCWNLHYSNNPGQGHGGSGCTCFGDSGGPVLYQGEIVAVNSFVLNNNCNGAGFGYRVDTSLVDAFLASFGYTG